MQVLLREVFTVLEKKVEKKFLSADTPSYFTKLNCKKHFIATE